MIASWSWAMFKSLSASFAAKIGVFCQRKLLKISYLKFFFYRGIEDIGSIAFRIVLQGFLQNK